MDPVDPRIPYSPIWWAGARSFPAVFLPDVERFKEPIQVYVEPTDDLLALLYASPSHNFAYERIAVQFEDSLWKREGKVPQSLSYPGGHLRSSEKRRGVSLRKGVVKFLVQVVISVGEASPGFPGGPALGLDHLGMRDAFLEGCFGHLVGGDMWRRKAGQRPGFRRRVNSSRLCLSRRPCPGDPTCRPFSNHVVEGVAVSYASRFYNARCLDRPVGLGRRAGMPFGGP